MNYQLTCVVLLIFSLCLIFLAGCQAGDDVKLRDGDLIFHRSLSAQSDALERALRSPYTHMGIIFIEDGQPLVYEAVGPVKKTPFAEWTARGQDGQYVVKRLRNSSSILTPAAIASLKSDVTKHLGKPYDFHFEWSDDRLYCSELVWKAYRDALDLEIGALRRFGEFDFSDPVVQATLKKRFGDKIPSEEQVISPADMFASDELKLVIDHSALE